jgi:hypothetical protein
LRYTCFNGIVELNTFVLVVKRMAKSGSGLHTALNAFYWLTTVGIRLIFVPYLTIYIQLEMDARYPFFERVIMVASQTFLCVFNVGLTVMQLIRKKNESKKD